MMLEKDVYPHRTAGTLYTCTYMSMIKERVIREAKGEAHERRDSCAVECRRGSADGTWRDVRSKE